MFIGEYQHTVDAKGRMFVPAKFRDELGEKFIVTIGLDRCLFVFPAETFEVYNEKLNAINTAIKNTMTLNFPIKIVLPTCLSNTLNKLGGHCATCDQTIYFILLVNLLLLISIHLKKYSIHILQKDDPLLTIRQNKKSPSAR